MVWQSRVCSRAGHPVAAPRERRWGCHSHMGSPSDVSTLRRGLCSPRHRVWSSPPGPACPTLTMAPSWATGFLWGLRWPRKECAAGLQLGTPFSSTPSPQVFQTLSVADWSADFLSLSLSEWPGPETRAARTWVRHFGPRERKKASQWHLETVMGWSKDLRGLREDHQTEEIRHL